MTDDSAGASGELEVDGEPGADGQGGQAPRSDDFSPSEPVDPRLDPAELSRTPNPRALLAVLLIVIVAAVAIGIGWR